MLCFIVTICLIYVYHVYVICRILGLVKKETSFSSELFKGRGRPLLFTIHEFFSISFEDGRHVLDAHVLRLIKIQAVIFSMQYGTCQ